MDHQVLLEFGMEQGFLQEYFMVATLVDYTPSYS
jgi:hypothetical protein